MHYRKHLAVFGLVCGMMIPTVLCGAEGYGLNEWSAEGMAMGGARMFAEDDAANLGYNPASITKNTGTLFKSSIAYISPHGKYKAIKKDDSIESGRNRVHPAYVPSMFYTKQIDDKQWFGVGVFARFGLVSEFEKSSIMASNAYHSKMTGITIAPTYARKLSDKVSAAVGMDINYVDLELNKILVGATDSKLAGDTWGVGWNAAVNYSFDDKNEVGLVYRSKISHTMTADFKYNAFGPYPAFSTKARGKVVLPDSYTIGYNHKFDEKTRVELQGMYTRWSTYDALNIRFDNPVLGNSASLDQKNWKNGWRYAIGVEHKLSQKYSLLGGIAYDASAIPDENADYMVPTGARRTYTIGAQYHDKIRTVALTLGWMDINGISILFIC